MVASTRFRRLFTSGRGYSLFMPAVIKVYTQSESHPGIRMAIEYAVNRFYALHQEAFIFQTVDIVGHLVSLPAADGDWLAKNVYHFLYALQRRINPSTPDAAGIHNANKTEEREALIATTAEDKPQMFFSSLRRGEVPGEPRIKIELPEEYESRRFGSDDLVRFFLTVIAHDPSTLRAEHFLRLLRFMTPYLYHASTSTRSVLQGGIDALALVVVKSLSKPKTNDTQPANDSGSESLLDNILHNKSQSACNILSMRIDYISLVSSFITGGGQLSRSTMNRAIDVTKVMLKEHLPETSKTVSIFLTDLCRSLLHRAQPDPKMVVYFLQDASPLISAHFPLVDLSGLFQAVAALATNPIYANEPAFAHVVITQICGPILETYEVAASSVALLSVPRRLNSGFVTLVGQAVLLRGTDIIAEIEKRAPSHDFLAAVILPLVMSLKTESQLVSDDIQAESWKRNALRRAWARLLSFAMNACESHRSLGRSRSQFKKSPKDPQRSKIPAIALVMQVLKVIVVRAEAELSACLPGIWLRLASFLVSNLAEGSAHFAFGPGEAVVTPTFTPITSPRTSTLLNDMESSISGNIHPSPSRSFASPRMIDYVLWSVLELICLVRTPLFLQMRLFILEKLIEPDQHLQRRQDMQNPAEHLSHRPVSASIYTKRRRSKLLDSTSQSHLSPSTSHGQTLSTLEVGRQPGYNVSSPHEPVPGGPTIVHLGPVSATSAMSAFGRALSGGRGRFEKSKNPNADGVHANVRSLVLMRETYRRVRTVQTCMGYELLLPIPTGHDTDGDQIFSRTWTRQEALSEIRKETEELLEEFEETDAGLDDEGVFVEADQSFSFAV